MNHPRRGFAKPWHDRFVATLPGGTAGVLDLGCGSGSPVAKYLAACGLHVTGVDSSPTLISLCRKRLPDHQRLVRLLRLPLRFGGILAWDSLFHLTPDDQRGMFDVFARHATPSATLMFNSGPTHGEVVGAYRDDPLYHASLHPDEYTAPLGSIGFAVVAHAAEDWRTGGTLFGEAQRDIMQYGIRRRAAQLINSNRAVTNSNKFILF